MRALEFLRRHLLLQLGANFIMVGKSFKDCDCGRYLVYECGDELYSVVPEEQYPRRPGLAHATGPNLVALSYPFAAALVAQLFERRAERTGPRAVGR